MSIALAGCAVVLFSLLSFWKYNAITFMLTAGVSLMLGLGWYDVYSTETGLSISLMLVGYSLACAAFAFACIFRGERREV